MSKPSRGAKRQRDRSRRVTGTRFLVTWNCELDRSDAMEQMFIRFDPEYMLACNERAPTTGRAHIHMLIILPVKKDFESYRAFELQGPNGKIGGDVEGVKSLTKTIAYLKKTKEWTEYGENPIHEQKIKREEKVKFACEHGVDSMIECGQFTLADMKNAMFLRDRLQLERIRWGRDKTRFVRWYYGPTGSGKTWTAVQEMEALYGEDWVIICGENNGFMNGYRGQRGVIFDDLRSGTFRFARLLQLLDKYRITVNIKGGHVTWAAETIIITAPVPPDEMFVDRETREPWDHLDQLMRRIALIRMFTARPRVEENEERPMETEPDPAAENTLSSIRPMEESAVISLPITFPDDPELRREQDDKYQ